MTKRDRTVLIVVLALAALVAPWLLIVSPKRDQAAKLGSQLTAAQNKLNSARSQLVSNQAARRQFANSYTVMARLGAAVPADDNVPSLIVQLQNAASATRVDFRSLALTPSAIGGAAPAPPPTSGPASATQSATAALPPGAAVGPAGFPTEPFTFTFQGNFFHLANFLGRLERFVVANNKGVAVSGRLMTLNAISLGAGPKGFPQITASIAATTYLVPASQGVTAGASPTGPSSSTTQTVSSTGSSSSSTTPAPTAAVTAPVR